MYPTRSRSVRIYPAIRQPMHLARRPPVKRHPEKKAPCKKARYKKAPWKRYPAARKHPVRSKSNLVDPPSSPSYGSYMFSLDVVTNNAIVLVRNAWLLFTLLWTTLMLPTIIFWPPWICKGWPPKKKGQHSHRYTVRNI